MNQEETPVDDRTEIPEIEEDRPLGGGFFTREVALYALAFAIGVAIMLLIPRLLNNMILVFIVMMLVIYIIPERYKRRRR